MQPHICKGGVGQPASPIFLCLLANTGITVIDDVSLVVREPLDRFQEIVTQSWTWRGGFCVPTDITADPAVIPTASPSYWKRAVVIECL
jgi:hypothetical protein